MRYLSLFSGIEAATVAWHPLGWECVAVAEVEPFPCAVLAHHYPSVPNLGDVTKITEADIQALGHIDIVVFGSPCQDLSVAGKRKGLINEHGDITRSGLFFTAINIFHWSRARFALWENVPGAFSSNKGRDFGSVVEFMAGLDECPIPPRGWATEGVAVGDNGLLEWCVLDAQWFGVAQRRRRVFALLDTGDWASRPPILLEPEGMRGDSAPCREKGEGVAGCAAQGAGVSGRTMYGVDVFPCLDRTNYEKGWCDQAVQQGLGVFAMSSGQANAEITRDHAPTLNCLHEAPIVTHSLRGEGFDASEDGTGRGTPLVPVVAGTMKACKDSGGWSNSADHAAAGYMVPVAFSSNMSVPDCQTDGTTPTLKLGGHGGGNPPAVTFSIMPMNSGKDYKARETEIAQPLMAGGPVGGNQGGDFVVATFQQSSMKGRGTIGYDESGVAKPVKTQMDGQMIAYGLTGNQGGDVVVAPALTASNDPSRSPQSSEVTNQVLAVMQATAYGFNGDQSEKTRSMGEKEEQAPTLRADGPAHVAAVAFDASSLGGGWAPQNVNPTEDICSTMNCTNQKAVATAMQVRRLTPVECERLQGFPDNYTNIPWRKQPTSPDGPRYKALGNSMAVPVMRWIGQSIFING